MKTIHHKIIPAGLGILAILPALAIEPPKDDAPPPPSVKPAASAQANSPASALAEPAEKGARMRIVPPAAGENASAFIGIISDDIPDLLAAHIGVKPGEGVMIRDLAPGGPAEKAGFAKYDVITHVGGRTIGSPADLSREISAGKPGDEVSIDLIHQGTKAAKTVKLETRPDGASRIVDPRQLGHLDLDDMPEGQADRIRDMIEKQLQGIMEDSKEFRNFGPRRDRKPDDQGGGVRGFQFKSDATIRLMDNDGSIELKASDGSKEITVRDRESKIVWSGSWNTEQDKAAAPKEIRERIEKSKLDDGFRGGGFRFRMGPGARDEE